MGVYGGGGRDLEEWGFQAKHKTVEIQSLKNQLREKCVRVLK